MNFLKIGGYGTVLLVVLATIACSKRENTAGVNDDTKLAVSAKGSETIDRRSTQGHIYTALDMSWDSLPAPEFEKVKVQIRDLYWSGAKRDDQKLAVDYVESYRHEKDVMKRSDMLKSVEPELAKHFEAAQQHHDFAVLTTSAQADPVVGAYDPNRGGFNVSFDAQLEKKGVGITKDAGGHDQWMIRFVGVPYQRNLLYKPADDAEAREIEAGLARNRTDSGNALSMSTAFLGSVGGIVDSAAESADTAVFVVDAISIVDPKSGQTLFTLGKKGELGPVEAACSTTRKALNLPEIKFEGGMYANPPEVC